MSKSHDSPHPRQRSISGVLDPRGTSGWGRDRGGRDGGDSSAEGGSALFPLGRGAWRSGTRRETANRLRRLRLSRPAAWPGAVAVTSVVVITGIIFIIGIIIGVTTVIAMSALRRDRRDGPDHWRGHRPDRRGHRPDGPDRRPPDLDRDGIPSETNQRWQARDGERGPSGPAAQVEVCHQAVLSSTCE